MNWLILFIRIATTLTFLILAAGGPWALWKLSRFIRTYKSAHEALKAEIEDLKQWRKVHEANHD